jgi:hypothetical protein
LEVVLGGRNFNVTLLRANGSVCDVALSSTKIDLCSVNVSLTKGITVLDAVLWIDFSWKETKDSTIISCFRIAGFPVVLIIKP